MMAMPRWPPCGFGRKHVSVPSALAGSTPASQTSLSSPAREAAAGSPSRRKSAGLQLVAPRAVAGEKPYARRDDVLCGEHAARVLTHRTSADLEEKPPLLAPAVPVAAPARCPCRAESLQDAQRLSKLRWRRFARNDAVRDRGTAEGSRLQPSIGGAGLGARSGTAGRLGVHSGVRQRLPDGRERHRCAPAAGRATEGAPSRHSAAF